MDGCGEPVHVKKEQLCGRHYGRLKRHGDPLAYKRQRHVCSVEGCDLGVVANGLCDKHYRRVRRYGTTDRPERPTVCVVPECGRPVTAWGLCDRHYRRSKDGKDQPRYCPICGTEIDQSAHGKRVFCSRECLFKANSVKQRETSRADQLRRYGLTVEGYDTLLAEQNGGCAICGSQDPRGRAGSPFFHVDHSHATGQIRGLLCAPCNSGLGMFGDDPDLLRRAAEYLTPER